MGMAIVELFMAIEDEFEIVFPNEIAPNLVLIGEIHKYVVKTLIERGETIDPVDIWVRLVNIVSDQSGTGFAQIYPETHLIYDLRLD